MHIICIDRYVLESKIRIRNIKLYVVGLHSPCDRYFFNKFNTNTIQQNFLHLCEAHEVMQ